MSYTKRLGYEDEPNRKPCDKHVQEFTRIVHNTSPWNRQDEGVFAMFCRYRGWAFANVSKHEHERLFPNGEYEVNLSLMQAAPDMYLAIKSFCKNYCKSKNCRHCIFHDSVKDVEDEMIRTGRIRDKHTTHIHFQKPLRALNGVLDTSILLSEKKSAEWNEAEERRVRRIKGETK